MRRAGLAFGIVLTLALASPASADPAATQPLPLPPPTSTSGPAPAPPPSTPAAAPAPAAAAASGVAVVATPGATDDAWRLAQAVYRTPELRPAALDEVHARVLCGEPPAASAPQDVRDLAEALSAARGEDAASRAILTDVARRLAVRALVVVHREADRPVARVFVADGASFDAATYGPDEAGSGAWTAATRSLARAFGTPVAAPALAAPPPFEAPALATHEEPPLQGEHPHPKAFYESGWFWGALGAAAFAAGAVFFATRDNSPTTIHLEMQVPH